MRTRFKTLLAVPAAAVLFTAIGSIGWSVPAQDPPDQPPRLIAIKFHADWCGYCKAMGPVFEELQAKYDQEPVLYLEFDQTREFDRRQSAFMAHTLGLERVWDEHGGTTGFVLLIDPESKRVLKRLGHEQNLKQMGAAIQETLRSSS